MIKRCLVILSLTLSLNAQSVPEEALKMAKETIDGKNHILNLEQDNSDIGIDNSIKIKDLSLGTPFKEYRLKPNAIQSISDSTSIASLLTDDTIWIFPIVAKNHMKIRIEFRKDSTGQWKIGRRGAPGLMSEWESIAKAWPESKGYHPIFIEANVGYFHVPEYDKYNFTRIYPNYDDKAKRFKKSSANYNILKYSIMDLKPKNEQK
jgi:hypothetical protein